MSRRGLVALALAWMAAWPALASDAEERARILRERAEARARHESEIAACAERFAATACEDAARARRRQALDHLARQEALLDAAQRKQRAAERLKRIEQKMNASEAAQAQAPEVAVKVRRSAAPAAAASAAARTPALGHAQAEAAPGPAKTRGDARRADAAPPSRPREPQRAEARRQAHAEREARAQAHRQAVEARNEARRKHQAPAAPLPVPGASAAAPLSR